MARASSVISVSIIGDAKKLIGAAKSADRATTGLLSSGVKTLGAFAAGAFTVDKAFSFLQSSIEESDRLGDSIFKLKTQIGDLSGPLEATAGNFAKIGASKQDMLELEATFAQFGTAAGITDGAIAKFAETTAATATALSLIRDESPAEILDLITKAAGGSEKAAKKLGVSLLDTKDAGAQLNNVLAQLKPALDDATLGTGDVEQKQAELQARVETLSAELGDKLQPALTDVLSVLLSIASHDWAYDFQRIGWGVGEILAPLARANDGLQLMLRLLGNIAAQGSDTFQVSTGRTSRNGDRNTSNAVQREQERSGLSTGMGVP